MTLDKSLNLLKLWFLYLNGSDFGEGAMKADMKVNWWTHFINHKVQAMNNIGMQGLKPASAEHWALGREPWVRFSAAFS